MSLEIKIILLWLQIRWIGHVWTLLLLNLRWHISLAFSFLTWEDASMNKTFHLRDSSFNFLKTSRVLFKWCLAHCSGWVPWEHVNSSCLWQMEPWIVILQFFSPVALHARIHNEVFNIKYFLDSLITLRKAHIWLTSFKIFLAWKPEIS